MPRTLSKPLSRLLVFLAPTMCAGRAVAQVEILTKPFAVTVAGGIIDRPANEDRLVTFSNGYPWFGDVDGDDKPDLLIGQGGGRASGPMGPEGRLRIYRNVGEAGRPQFGAPVLFDASVPTGLIPAG
jgi:hypothetical protein